MADDLGYSDLASYGSSHVKTPNIDALSQRGVRFTQAYVTAPICSPSRAGLITGRYQQRFGYEFLPHNAVDPRQLPEEGRRLLEEHGKRVGNIPEPIADLTAFNRIPKGLPAEEVSLAELLKPAGYKTAFIGKWHLGAQDGFFPDQHGFDYSYYFQGGGSRYVDTQHEADYVNKRLPWCLTDLVMWRKREGESALREGRTMVDDTGYLTFSLADKATRFIADNRQNPFFLLLSLNAPHDPFQAPKRYVDRIQNEQDTVERIYYAMIEALDDAVGQVVKQVNSAGLGQNTLIVFISDNGGAAYTRATDNAPLRGGKMSHFEGGIAVPFFINYPAAFSGVKTYDQPVSSLDIFATIAAVTQTKLPADRRYDGVNLLPFVLGRNTARPHDTFFWRSGYSKAFRKGDWKLYLNERNKKVLLFNLANDRSEQTDLSGTNPAKLLELRQELERWEKQEMRAPRWQNSNNCTIQVRGEDYYFPI
ncbi:sulfatase-like hydrolase/transferase [Nibrella saemangeumensis]|uniref:Sulfatase-like hydrolase/transferase n=2 Tax=Nibrella saemangeumensis TaxID=1084526 RepID=A0ABP8N5Q1_9BACT